MVEDVAEANKKALDILNKGVDSLGFVLSNCKKFAKADMAALLKDICLECIEINFVACCNKVTILNLFKEYVTEKGIDPEKIKGGINIDPISKLLLQGKFCDAKPFDVVKPLPKVPLP